MAVRFILFAMSKIRSHSGARSLRRAAAAGLVSVSLLTAPAANAQTAPSFDTLSSDVQSQVDSFLGQTRESAWTSRNDILESLRASNPQAADALRPVIDGAIELIFPGLIEQKNAEIRAAREAEERAHAEQVAREKAAAEEAARKAEAERKAQRFDTGPCPADARICVDRGGHRSWLQDGNGNVTYVAQGVSTGKPGEETPAGTFYINRKIKDEISWEFGDAPMPYAMYFTNNGHAFHEGSPAYQSNGCVRLTHQDAVRYWNDVPMGSKVFIY